MHKVPHLPWSAHNAVVLLKPEGPCVTHSASAGYKPWKCSGYPKQWFKGVYDPHQKVQHRTSVSDLQNPEKNINKDIRIINHTFYVLTTGLEGRKGHGFRLHESFEPVIATKLQIILTKRELVAISLWKLLHHLELENGTNYFSQQQKFLNEKLENTILKPCHHQH